MPAGRVAARFDKKFLVTTGIRRSSSVARITFHGRDSYSSPGQVDHEEPGWRFVSQVATFEPKPDILPETNQACLFAVEFFCAQRLDESRYLYFTLLILLRE